MEWLVERLTNKGDTVLDPFLGSGTTAIACMKHNRNCVGFELDKNYYDKIIKRMKQYR